jgi:hypothetical protein
MNIIISFLTILDQIKIYHWQTLKYSRHKATDELHEKLSELIDRFIEVLQGRNILEKKDKRILIDENKDFIKIHNVNDENGLALINNIKKFLESNYLITLINNSSELLNIRDEMLSIVNQTAYLFTLD